MSSDHSVESAIADLLKRIPRTWESFEMDQLAETESDALVLLMAAGMVERRFELRLRMLNHPTAMSAKASATGEYGLVEAIDRLIAGIWHEWQESYETWKQSETRESVPFVCERIGKDEWRLTKQGIAACDDLRAGQVDRVCDFVLKQDFFLGRLPCRGAGQLLTFDKITQDHTPDPGNVQVTNWEEGAQAFYHLFETFLQSQQKNKQWRSDVPEGKGSGATIGDMLAEYLQQRRQRYDQLVLAALGQNNGAVAEFEAMFGPRAIARYWLTNWIKKLAKQLDDPQQRSEVIDKEENRVAGAIKRQPLYQKWIHPPLNGRKPDDWEPPAQSGSFIHPAISEILDEDKQK